MKKNILLVSAILFAMAFVSCGGAKEGETKEKATVEVVKADPLKTAEELRQCEKFDETAIAALENKDAVIRFSSGYNLTEIPTAVFSARNLQTIELNNYQGTSLPIELAKMQNISNIYISGGIKFTSLPEFLPELKNLKTISISSAKGLNLTEAFKILSKCENLEYVQITNSLIETTLPAEIGNMKNLKVLDLSYNKITSFPAEFYKLPKLEKLILGGVFISGFNFDDLFANMKTLPKLKSLTFQYAGFNDLPKVLNEYPSLESVYWREEGKGWATSDEIIKTVENMGKKFPSLTISWNSGGTLFYDYN